MKIAGLACLIIGLAAVASAAVPEIDAANGVNAIALLAGVVLIVRSRKSAQK